MKVMMYRYNSICEPDVKIALEALDFQVVEMTTEMSNKDITPPEAVKMISTFLQDNPVDFVFSINFFPYVAEVCYLFNLCYVSWIVDAPVLELYSNAIKRPTNRIFIFDRALYNDIACYNPDCIFHFPLAANVAARDEVISAASQPTKEKFSHEVAFVGSLYTEKAPYNQVRGLSDRTKGYLEALMLAQQKIYGYYFIEELLDDEQVREFSQKHPDFYRLPEGNLLTDKRTLAQFYMGNKISSMERVDTFKLLAKNFNVSIYTGSNTDGIFGIHNMGFAKTATEMPLIFNGSKINMNITSKGIRTGIPLRVFDILSSGGFMISNYQEELYEFFTPGEEFVVYSDMDELLYLTEYYLNHESERKEIARAGYERVKKDYTYKIQLEKLLLQAFSSNIRG